MQPLPVGYRWHAVSKCLPNLSYRQVDYWIRVGTIELRYPQSGSGNPRTFTLEEVMRLRVLDRVLPQLGIYSGGPGRGAGQQLPAEWIRYIWKASNIEDVNQIYLFQVDQKWNVSTQPPTKHVSSYIVVDVSWNEDWLTDDPAASPPPVSPTPTPTPLAGVS